MGCHRGALRFCYSAVNLRFSPLELRLTDRWRISRHSGIASSTVVTLELADGRGTHAFGEAAPISRYDESPESVAAFLLRVDPVRLAFDDVDAAMAYLDSISPRDAAAKCGLNLALLDGAAKRARQPLHDFLGLAFKEGQHATSFSLGIDTPERTREKAAAAAANFPILKMKLGGPDDDENLRIAREVAPETTLRLDANEAWKSGAQALAEIERAARHGNIQFVEQPLPASAAPREWTWLKQRSPLPIFADESFHTAADIAWAAQCVHGVNVKLAKAGGITNAMAALRAARNAGLKTMLGCMIETSILISAAAHLADMCDYLDLDGNLLVANDPFRGIACANGILSFARAEEPYGLRVSRKPAAET